MRKILTTALLLASLAANAQVSTEARTTVTILLRDFISIESGNGGLVGFEYRGPEDYKENKVVREENDLITSSSQSYNVTVKAMGPNFISSSSTIPLRVLEIRARENSTVGGNLNRVVLRESERTLVKGADPGIEKSLDIDYIITKEKAIEHILGKRPGNYYQIVRYTLTTE